MNKDGVYNNQLRNQHHSVTGGGQKIPTSGYSRRLMHHSESQLLPSQLRVTEMS